MNYTDSFNNVFINLQKSIHTSDRLSYFKNELLKILDKKEISENHISKSIHDYFNSINTTLFGIGIEKGRVGTIGEIRTWKDGKKYKKMPDGKWVRVYQHQNRSAEISIARLKGKVRNAQSVDELMNIVMNNIHRFEDENGQILPIVEELKKEVASGKTRINTGKPSTKEQIEKFNADKKAKENPLHKFELDYESIMKFESVDERHKYLSKLRDHIEEEKNKKLSEFRKENLELMENDNKQFYEKRHEVVKPYHDLWSKITDEIMKIATETTEYKERQRQIQEIKEKRIAEKKAKMDKANKKLAEKQNKVDDAAKEYRTNASIESLEKEIPDLTEKFKEIDEKRKKLESELKWRKSVANYKKKETDRWERYGEKEIAEAKEYVKEHDSELKELKPQVEKLKLELNAKMDIYMDLMEQREYIPDDRIEKCSTVHEVNDLFNSNKDWFIYGNETNFKKIDLQSAKEIYKCYDRMFNRFPIMKGICVSPSEGLIGKRTYASAWGGFEMLVNPSYFSNWEKTEKLYSEDVESSFHPEGTDLRCVFYHEFAHLIDGNIVTYFAPISGKMKFASDNIQNAVLTKFTGHDSVSKELSKYATKNASEFLAEGISEALNSENPRRFARECLRQLYKEILMAKPQFESKRNKYKIKG